jgi:hypothetical protein
MDLRGELPTLVEWTLGPIEGRSVAREGILKSF